MAGVLRTVRAAEAGSSVILHIRGSIPGVVGMSATSTGAFVSWLTNDAMPVMSAIATLVTILAGLATTAYYFTKWRRLRYEK